MDDDERGLLGRSAQESVEVVVRSERFKFNAAHFVAFEGYRERLHGHNYTAAVRLIGETNVRDGYVIDFTEVKKVVRAVCERLNERFLCPCRATAMAVGSDGGNVTLRCEDGSFFSFPRDDCAMLPIVHSTAEELAAMLWRRILDEFTAARFKERRIVAMEVAVAEAPMQEARYFRRIDYDEEEEAPPPPAQPTCKAFAVPSPSSSSET
eukprot:CAMPEP_0118906786 /NCGR_PEP_ID=MMETSP1166-20130328/10510_1 /TAXON_ID=1104430 /ORGANISM="Chrysoreinhardia sp, Strain CCMP3193" /LENGTH=208 /DNA_ID=CAMNT_0006846141 /DNA_START=67 /DNA_END=693 /DNA_ORIENTATION=-